MRAGFLLCIALAASGCASEVVLEENRASHYGGREALERARSMAKTVEAICDGTGNLGRYSATVDRIGDLGLRNYMTTRWIDWFTPQRTIVLDVPGRNADGKEPLVIVVAHYDKTEIRPDALVSRLFFDVLDPLISWSFLSSGAIDDASGCAVVLELARAVSARPGPESYRFVLLGAEESDQRGSRGYMASLGRSSIERTRLVVKLDSVGVRGTRHGVLESTKRPEIIARALDVAARRGFELEPWRAPGPFCGDDDAFASVSPLLEVARGLFFNPVGLLPQRSWFTTGRGVPTIAFASVDCVSVLDVLPAIFPLPIGKVHGVRDRPGALDAWLLYEQLEIVRELAALPTFEPESPPLVPAPAPASPVAPAPQPPSIDTTVEAAKKKR